jgi:hypothetical protein
LISLIPFGKIEGQSKDINLKNTVNKNKAYQYCCSNPLDKHHWLKQYIAGLVELHISSNPQIVLSKTLETKKRGHG